MKKTSLLFMMLLSIMTATMAQTVSVGAFNKSFNILETQNAKIVGTYNGHYLAVTNNYSGFFRCLNCMVLEIDDNMNIVRQIEFQDTKGDEVSAASLYEGKVYVLLTHETRNEMTFKRYVVDVASLQLNGDPTVIHKYETVRKDRVYHWVAQSPDKSLTGLVNIVLNKKNDNFTAVEMLLDEEMNVEWRQEYQIRAMDDLMVTNDGELITMGKTVQTRGEASKIFLTHLDADNAQDFSQTIDISIDRVKLISYKNGKILAMAMGISVGDKRSFKYCGIAYDIPKNEANVSYRTLTDEEKCVVYNYKTGGTTREIYSDFMTLTGCEATSEGGAFSIRLIRGVTTCNSQGQCNTVFYGFGSILVGINSNGDVVWHHPIRSYCKNNGVDFFIRSAICESDGNVYYLQSENPKWGESYNIAKKAAKLNPMKGSKALGIYRVTPDGGISKSVQPLEKKLTLTSEIHNIDNTHIGFLTLRKGVSMLKMKF